MAETLGAIASLLWPVLVALALLLFRKPLLRLLGSAEHREWSIEVGGQKVGMKSLDQQKETMIADLQTQVGILRNEITALRANTAAEVSEADETDLAEQAEVDLPVANSVLWVDDAPENNALIIKRLQDNDIRVELARSTSEGMRKFKVRRYGAVLSDMGRVEQKVDIPDAGLRLLHDVREADPRIPFLIFCGSYGRDTFGNTALDQGATLVTNSATELVNELQALKLL